MEKQVIFDQIMSSFRSAIRNFPDKRTGSNLTHTMEDIALGGFSVFFTQSPSFLAHQKSMNEAKGKSNAETLFGIEEIPTDNHIRDILDEISPEHVFPVFDDILAVFKRGDYLDSFRDVHENILIALDGTWYFSSQNIHCDNCSTIEQKNGKTTYYHSAITPVIVGPGQNKAIPLRPEFIIPQDGHDKQDCEIAAAKRWINKYAKQYGSMGDVTILGDDLFSKQPFCKQVLKADLHFIFVCKPESHKTLYEWVELLEPGEDLYTLTYRRWNGRCREIYTYRYANDVPLRDTEDGLMVNWFETTIYKESGEILYKNGFITDHKVTKENVASLVLSGRARWKVENENNNTLKTKGYHLEHNFGHGKKYLSSVLATLNILAFLFHTLLECMDKKYRLLRKRLPSRKTFFDDIRALTRYICFESWEHLLDFMLKGLEIKLDTS